MVSITMGACQKTDGDDFKEDTPSTPTTPSTPEESEDEEGKAKEPETPAMSEQLTAIYNMAVGIGSGKDWTWNTDAPDGTVWGNMGYCGGSGEDVALNGAGKWWGVTCEEAFHDQIQHTGYDGLLGDESMDAYFTLTSDGQISRHRADGSIIHSGTYEFEEVFDNKWKIANLHTTAGTILWPYEINSGGNKPTTFEVLYLTDKRMMLVYPDHGDFYNLGSWSEATYWQFRAKDDDIYSMIAGYGNGKDWTWNTETLDGMVWGNMGYCGGNGKEVALNGAGKWWGVNSADGVNGFNNQLGHTNDLTNHGDGDLDAFMTLEVSGLIKRCTADGTIISSGIYEIEETPNNEWKVANLHTTAGTILWPYEINSGGRMPTVFEIVYLTNERMTLVYPNNGAFESLGSWNEATYWEFKAK